MSDGSSLGARVCAPGGEVVYHNAKVHASKCGSGPIARLVATPEEGEPVGKLFGFVGTLALRRAPPVAQIANPPLYLWFTTAAPTSADAGVADKRIETRTILRIQPIHDSTTDAAGVRITFAQTPRAWTVFNLLFCAGNTAADNKNTCANFLGRLAQHDNLVTILPRAWRAHQALPVSATPAAAVAATPAAAAATSELPATSGDAVTSGDAATDVVKFPARTDIAYIDTYALRACYDLFAWGSQWFIGHTGRCETLSLETGRLFIGKIQNTDEPVLSFRGNKSGVRKTLTASSIDHIGIHRGPTPADGCHVRLNFGRPSGRRLHMNLRFRSEDALRTFLSEFGDVASSEIAPAWTGSRPAALILSENYAPYFPIVSVHVCASERVEGMHANSLRSIDTALIKNRQLRMELVKTGTHAMMIILEGSGKHDRCSYIERAWIDNIYRVHAMGVRGYTDHYRINYHTNQTWYSITFSLRNVCIPSEAASKFRDALARQFALGQGGEIRTTSLFSSGISRPGETFGVPQGNGAISASVVEATIASVAGAPSAAPAAAPAAAAPAPAPAPMPVFKLLALGNPGRSNHDDTDINAAGYKRPSDTGELALLDKPNREVVFTADEYRDGFLFDDIVSVHWSLAYDANAGVTALPHVRFNITLSQETTKKPYHFDFAFATNAEHASFRDAFEKLLATAPLASSKPARPTMTSNWQALSMPTGTFLMPAFHPFAELELFQLRNQNAMALVLPKYRRSYPQFPTIAIANFETEVIDKILALPVFPPIACADPKRVWKQNVVDALNCHHYKPNAYEVKRPDFVSIHDPWSKLVTETEKIRLDICVGLDGGSLHKVPDRMLLHNLIAARKVQQDLIEKEREAIHKWDEEHAEVFESAPSMTYEEAFAKKDREARKRSIDLT